MKSSRQRRSRFEGDSFGMPLADLLTTALGCIMLIFMVSSIYMKDMIISEQTAHKRVRTDLMTVEERARLLEEAREEARLEYVKLKDQLKARNQELTQLQQDNKTMKAQFEFDLQKARDLVEKSGGILTHFKQNTSQVITALNPKTAQPVDVMLVIDGTLSMQPSLDMTRQNLSAIIGALRVISPTVRIGFTVFRDKRERKKLRLEYQALTDNEDRLKRFLRKIKATSTKRDRDRPEWMCGGLEKGAKTKWRAEAIKLIVIVSDAAPQSRKAKKCVKIAKRFRKKGGTIHVASTIPEGYERRKDVTKEYNQIVLRDHALIAKAGGGKHIKKANDSTLLEVVLRSTFESRTKVPLEILQTITQ